MPRVKRVEPQGQLSIGNQPNIPMSFGTGPGQAMQSVARGIGQLGAGLESAANAAAKEKDDLDLFKTKMILGDFKGEQDRKHLEFNTGIDGDGQGHAQNRLNAFDTDTTSLYEKIPTNPKARQYAALTLNRMREGYGTDAAEREFKQRGTYYHNEVSGLIEREVGTRKYGNVGSAMETLSAVEGAISAARGLSPSDAARLRSKAVDTAFEAWLRSAGQEAQIQAETLAAAYSPAARKGPTPGSPRAAQEAGLGEAAEPPQPSTPTRKLSILDRAPSSSEREAIARRGGVVVNLDTNWGSARSGGVTGPMVVVPDNASPDMRKAAMAYATAMAKVHFEKFGRSFKPYVKTRSENGRGRSHTIHTEPYAVTDAKAVEFFSTEEGKRLHANILRETLGTIKGAQFSLPHGGVRGRDKGAVANNTNEVLLAQGVLGYLSRSDGDIVHRAGFKGESLTGQEEPSTVKVKTVDGGVYELPAKPTIRDAFAKKVIENLPAIRKASLRAAAAEEKAEREAVKAQEDAKLKEGIDLLYTNKLTREWVEKNRETLSPSRYEQFLRAVQPRVEETDPDTFASLIEDAPDPERAEEVIDNALRAYEQGKITKSDFSLIYRQAQKALNPADKTPRWAGEMRSDVKRQLRPPNGADASQIEVYQAALKEFDAYVDEHGEKLDRKTLMEWSKQLVERSKVARVTDGRRALSMPSRSSDVGRDAMTLQEVEDAKGRLYLMLQNGSISPAEANAEWKTLEQWQKILEEEHRVRGKEPPKIVPFSAPAAKEGPATTAAKPAGEETAAGNDMGFVPEGMKLDPKAAVEVKGAQDTAPNEATVEALTDEEAAPVVSEILKTVFGQGFDPMTEGPIGESKALEAANMESSEFDTADVLKQLAKTQEWDNSIFGRIDKWAAGLIEGYDAAVRSGSEADVEAIRNRIAAMGGPIGEALLKQMETGEVQPLTPQQILGIEEALKRAGISRADLSRALAGPATQARPDLVVMALESVRSASRWLSMDPENIRPQDMLAPVGGSFMAAPFAPRNAVGIVGGRLAQTAKQEAADYAERRAVNVTEQRGAALRSYLSNRRQAKARGEVVDEAAERTKLFAQLNADNAKASKAGSAAGVAAAASDEREKESKR